MRHTALGALFAQQMDEVLASAAPVPENCTASGQDTGAYNNLQRIGKHRFREYHSGRKHESVH